MNPREIVDRVLYFRSHPAFQELALEHLVSLARSCSSAFLPAGASAPTAASHDQDTILFVTAGELDVTTTPVPKRIGPGEAAGLMHLLAGQRPRPARAVEATTAIAMEREDFEELLEQQFEIALSLIRHICRASIDRIAVLAPGHVLHGLRPGPGARKPRSSFADRLATLVESTWFPGEHVDALAELAVHVTEVSFGSDERLWVPGDRADHFLVIISGQVRCATGPSWHCHGGEGVTVGEFEALAGLRRRFEAVAEQPIRALRVETGAFLDILEDHPHMAVSVAGILADRYLFLLGEPGTPP